MVAMAEPTPARRGCGRCREVTMRMRSTSIAALGILLCVLPSSRSSSSRPLKGVLRQVIQDADTCMYLMAGDKEYLLDSWRGAEAGDCVIFGGSESADCEPRCEARDGCLRPIILGVEYGCELTECGQLTGGLGECVYFESDAVGKYLLSDRGGFGIGDSVRISGAMEWCLTECLETHRCIVVQDLVPCDANPILRTTWGRVRTIFR
jgi:hypothetical protein